MAGRRPGTRLEGLLWAIVTVAIFAGWFPVTRLAVTSDLRIWDITALRFGVGALLLCPAILRPGAWLPASAWREGLVFAALWGVPFVLLVAFGLELTGAAQAAAVTPTLMPVFAGLFARAVLGERQGRARWLGFAAIVAGLACLIAAGGPPHPLGIAALAAGSASWATYTLLFRGSRLRPIQAAALICVISALLYLPAYAALGLSRLGQAPAGELAVQVFYQGALMSGVAIVSFNRAVTLLGAVATGAIIALLPAVAAAIAIPVLGEMPTAGAGVAIAVIAVGVLLASRPRPAVQQAVTSTYR